ncbi:MAG: hypothetical protein R3B48_08030 [Kofleriaceae bacterium]
MRRVIATALLIGLTSWSCVSRIQRKVGVSLATVDLKAAYLKAHMKSGELFVLSKWSIDESARVIFGTGELYGLGRGQGIPGDYRVPFDQVALYETNTVEISPVVAAMSVITGISVAVSVACLSNPKACFGSCPTFYATTDDGERVLQAEGFSDSIAPSLEANDIDALWQSTGRGGELSLLMTNEAYETHVIKQADLLAIPRPPGGRVLVEGGRFWAASSLRAPTQCTSAAGDCRDEVRALDHRERTTLTSEEDLAARETIDLAFAPAAPGERVAIVLGARQTLVTTFLLYQGLAYLGTTATSWLARAESGASLSKGLDLSKLLGGIEVQVRRDGAWETLGQAYETGPIATDVHTVMLPEGVTGEALRLRLPRGGWRLDYVALATIDQEVTPLRVSPTRIRGELSRDFGPGRTAAAALPIVTVPGDEYTLEYHLPPGETYDLFLDSRGYYLEWMRQEWMREERPLAALRMLLDPQQALRDLAPEFKKLEPQAEELFWRSRYARP